MILWMTLLGCADKTEDTATTIEDTSAEDTGQTDTDTSTDTVDTDSGQEDTGDEIAGPIRPFCKMTSNTLTENSEVLSVIEFAWDGLTQTSDYESMEVTYNEYGARLTSYRNVDGYVYEVTSEFECDGWCKEQRSVWSQGSPDQTPYVTEDVYLWEGNKQILTDTGTASRYWIYNDMGAVIEFFDGGETYANLSEYEYDCNEYWCKNTAMMSTSVVNGETTIQEYTYEWEGNRQTGGTYYNYQLYNDYGYLLEREYSQSGNIYRQNWTYDCD